MSHEPSPPSAPAAGAARAPVRPRRATERTMTRRAIVRLPYQRALKDTENFDTES